MTQQQHLTVIAESKQRLDVCLAKHTNMSRAHCQQLIKNNFVLKESDNSPITSCSYAVTPLEVFIIHTRPPEDSTIVPEDIPLTIVYEDEHIIIINKQAGMVVHPAPGHHSGTLVNALLHHCKDSLSGINGITKPGIVHRLDKDTSGLIIAAKNDSAHLHLAQQIESRAMQRTYAAFCHGSVAPRVMDIIEPIGRHPTQRTKMSVTKKGRHAHTTLKTFLVSKAKNLGTVSLVQCTLHTGRTHQIRVHCAHQRHPVLNDILYGGQNITLHEPKMREGRQALHAQSLALTHPRSKAPLSFIAPPPEDLKALHKKLKQGEVLFNSEQHVREIFPD